MQAEATRTTAGDTTDTVPAASRDAGQLPASVLLTGTAVHSVPAGAHRSSGTVGASHATVAAMAAVAPTTATTALAADALAVGQPPLAAVSFSPPSASQQMLAKGQGVGLMAT